MPRRREVPKREVTPDPKYLSETVAKFITVVMKSGKKSVAEKIVYGALDTMAERSKKDPIEMFNQALTNVRPLVGSRAGVSAAPLIRYRWKCARDARRRWRCVGWWKPPVPAVASPWRHAWRMN